MPPQAVFRAHSDSAITSDATMITSLLELFQTYNSAAGLKSGDEEGIPRPYAINRQCAATIRVMASKMEQVRLQYYSFRPRRNLLRQ